MASPRKHYFRVADSILREPWDAQTGWTIVRLCAWLNQRWARDGLSSQEAGEALLRPGDVSTVTGTTTPRRARRRLLDLPRVAGLSSMRVLPERHGRDTCVRVIWPKFSEFQGFQDREAPASGEGRADPGHEASRELPLPHPHPHPPPQDQTRPERTSESEGRAPLCPEPDPVLPPESLHTAKRWLQTRGHRVSDSVVRALFKERMRQWSPTAALPDSPGAAFVAWLKKQDREGDLFKIVEECGGSSLKAEVNEILADVAAGEHGTAPSHVAAGEHGSAPSDADGGGLGGELLDPANGCEQRLEIKMVAGVELYVAWDPKGSGRRWQLRRDGEVVAETEPEDHATAQGWIGALQRGEVPEAARP